MKLLHYTVLRSDQAEMLFGRMDVGRVLREGHDFATGDALLAAFDETVRDLRQGEIEFRSGAGLTAFSWDGQRIRVRVLVARPSGRPGA